jgi:S-adenosylhomocysteine hydrolase
MNRNIEIGLRERIEIDASGDARCRRTYSFFNRHTKAVQIDSIFGLAFDKYVVPDRIYFDQDRTFQTREIREAYQVKVVVLITTRDLQPQERLDLSVEYRWQNFVPPRTVPSFSRELSFMHSFEFHYELEISSSDPGLFDNPAFNILPAESRLPERQVIHVAENNGYLVRTNGVPSNTNLTIAISGGQGGVSELPLLTSLGREFHEKAPFRDVSVIFIQHLLHDFEALIKSFSRAGMRSDNTFIIGIPYSTKDDVVKRLRASYGHVISPNDYPFREDVRAVILKVHRRCERQGQRFIVVEDGGYIAGLMRDDPDGPKWAERCIGIVEQTRNGIWGTQDWEKRPELYLNELCVGVINVAETELKLKGESPLIGRAVVGNIEHLLRVYEDQDLHQLKALVVGCGSTGSEIAKALLARGCDVIVVESKKKDEIEKFPEGAVYRHISELAAVISDRDLIVGVTGRGVGVPDPESRPPFDSESLFLELKDRAALVNASSKMCEFNWEAIKMYPQHPLLNGDLDINANFETGRSSVSQPMVFR